MCSGEISSKPLISSFLFAKRLWNECMWKRKKKKKPPNIMSKPKCQFFQKSYYIMTSNEKPVCLCLITCLLVYLNGQAIYITVLRYSSKHVQFPLYVSCTGWTTRNLVNEYHIMGESYMYSRSIKLNWIITNTNTHIYPCVSQYISNKTKLNMYGVFKKS